MPIFQVDSEALSTKSNAVQGTIGRIQDEVQAMQAGLRELEGMWQGAAATHFQMLIADWRGTQAKVEESLANINAALSMASQQYAQTEDANTRLFAH